MNRNIYGAQETNSLGMNGSAYHAAYSKAEKVPWTTPGLKVTRLRLLSDPGYPAWDVSYCHGELNGKPVNVELPFSDLPKRRMMGAIIAYAQKDGINAKRIGVFNAISTLN